MDVMTLHKWFDEDVECVRWEGHEDVRTIGLKGFKGLEGTALLVSKEDAIALANEFGLVVYPKDAKL